MTVYPEKFYHVQMPNACYSVYGAAEALAWQQWAEYWLGVVCYIDGWSLT